MKKQRGITLIALVITIVVLIILAGVAINLTIGENGIFTRAEEAKLQYEIAQAKEELDLKILKLQVEKQGSATLQDVVDMLKDEDMNYVVSLEEIASITGVETIGDANEIYVVYKIYQFRIYDTLETEFISIVDYEQDEEEEGTPPTETYTVTLSGSNVTSNGATQVNKNESYTATITPAEGYGIATVEVKMGGTTLTKGTDYTYTDGILTIGNVTGNVEINVTAYETVESQKTSATTAETYYDTEKTLIDSDGNIVKVPAGFKVAEDSGINVTQGIVIEDNDIKTGIGNNRGNQYVWIPVGENIKKADGTTVDITLGRYKFADGTSEYTDSEGNTLSKGTPILVQSIDNYTNQSSEVQIAGHENRLFYEDISPRNGNSNSGPTGKNATALSISDFKTSVTEKHGYYIARYEASYGIDKKANSKVSNSAGTVAPTAEGTLWNNITQINATVASRGLYNTVTSDLVNSYAWDTAIVYIQAFSEDSDYSYQTSINTSTNGGLLNTGREEYKDEVCKINDMASNLREWTTEYCSYSTDSLACPCGYRGGIYSSDSNYTSYRGDANATVANGNISFRTILY